MAPGIKSNYVASQINATGLKSNYDGSLNDRGVSSQPIAAPPAELLNPPIACLADTMRLLFPVVVQINVHYCNTNTMSCYGPAS